MAGGQPLSAGDDASAKAIATEAGFPKHRIEALADGICAIVMTLLVLELIGGSLAEAHDANAVNEALARLWPKVLSYVISFVVVSILWVAHHAQFHWLRRTERRHIWINLIFLLSLSFLPFSAALLGEHPAVRAAVVIYGANVIVAGGTLLISWRYALRHELVVPKRPPGVDEQISGRLVAGQIGYWPAMAIGFVSPRIAFWLYVGFSVAYVVVQMRPEPRDHVPGR